MKIEDTKLNGCFLITPLLFTDNRGYFYESFNKRILDEAIGYQVNFV